MPLTSLSINPRDAEEQVKVDASTNVALIPQWATWNKASAGAWFQANIDDVLATIPDVDTLTPTQFQNNAQAIISAMQDVIIAQSTVIKNLGLVVIELRNKQWPGMQE